MSTSYKREDKGVVNDIVVFHSIFCLTGNRIDTLNASNA
jgi:hypothetical protein